MNVFVERIVADRWAGERCHEETFFNPTFDGALALIDGLDAETRTLLSLYAKNKTHLTVGGGGNGQYFVYVSSYNQFCNLLSSAANDDFIVIHAGGEPRQFPARQVVDRNQVKQAVQFFLRTGGLVPRSQWEKHG